MTAPNLPAEMREALAEALDDSEHVQHRGAYDDTCGTCARGRLEANRKAATLAPLIARWLAEAKGEAFDVALAQVVSGVESAMEAHREHGNRRIVAALSGLVTAVPRTENPYRAGAA